MANKVTPEHLLAETSWLHALAKGLVANDSRADDLVQQVLVEALEKPPRQVGALRGMDENRRPELRTKRGPRGTQSQAPRKARSHAGIVSTGR